VNVQLHAVADITASIWQPKLISGELRVPDVEKILENAV